MATFTLVIPVSTWIHGFKETNSHMLIHLYLSIKEKDNNFAMLHVFGICVRVFYSKQYVSIAVVVVGS